MRFGMIALGLGMAIVFGMITLVAIGYDEPYYENGVLVGYYYIKPEAIWFFGALTFFGLVMFLIGLALPSPEKKKARKIRYNPQSNPMAETIIVESGMAVCPSCEGIISEGSPFCPHCGQKLS